MIDFIRRHPKLLFWSISFLTLVTGYLLASVNWTMLQLIVLKGKNPNPPPPPCPAPPPREPEEPKRKMLQYHYVPSWVAASFKNAHKHPLYGGITVPTYGGAATAPLPTLSVTTSAPDEPAKTDYYDSANFATEPAQVIEPLVEQPELSPTINAAEEPAPTEPLESVTNAD
jgi:hypothetical protein